MEATLITRGRSTSLMMRFIPERRITSWSWFFRSLMHPYFGMKERISFFRSWIPWGRLRQMSAIRESGRNGDISELTKRTFFAVSAILLRLKSQILTKVRIFFQILINHYL